jgi:hypothetical protein
MEITDIARNKIKEELDKNPGKSFIVGLAGFA